MAQLVGVALPGVTGGAGAGTGVPGIADVLQQQLCIVRDVDGDLARMGGCEEEMVVRLTLQVSIRKGLASGIHKPCQCCE